MLRRALLASLASLPLAARARAQDALPARYHRLILRAGPEDALLPVLRYEGNNLGMRGPRVAGDGSPFAADGATIARRWQRQAAACAGIFVLRDTLFSQQDHPLDHPPHALMMPPSWVSVAVEEARAGRAITAMSAPQGDDRAWAALTDARIFGSFPISTRLGELARGSMSDPDPHRRARVAHARASLRSLAADVAAMIASRDPAAIAAAGAARIAASDRRYFGSQRARVSAIFVESPNEHERVDEGKGMLPPDRTIDPASAAIARRAVYTARLADGDLSLERYDITRADERARVIAVLEELVPRGARPPGGTVWVWAHAGYDGHSTRGPDPLPHVPRFRRELARARIDRARVRILARPSLELPRGGDRLAALEAALTAHERIDLPLSVHTGTRSLLRLLAG